MDEKINELPFRKSRVPVLRVLKGFFNLKNKIMILDIILGIVIGIIFCILLLTYLWNRD